MDPRDIGFVHICHLPKQTTNIFDSSSLKIAAVIKYFIISHLFLFNSISAEEFFASDCFSLTILSSLVYTTKLIH